MSARRRVVYLSLGAPHLEYPGVVAALDELGVDAEMVHLHDVDAVDWDRVDLVSARMCRGCPAHPDFLPRLEALNDHLVHLPNGPVPLVNSIELIRDALDKGIYLRKLADTGVELIPTRWVQAGSRAVLGEVMDEAGWDDVVVKPAVSAGSWRTTRVSRADVSADPNHHLLGAAAQEDFAHLSATHDLCVQPFQPAILDEGELSFVYLGGALSHVVHKTVGEQGGWWAHERLGGTNFSHNASAADAAWADSVHNALDMIYGPMTFGRIDGIRRPDGELRLLECELAIPRLLLPEGRAFDRYAQVMVEALDRLAVAV